MTPKYVFNMKPDEKTLKKSYSCSKCAGRKTVNWLPSSETWQCSACGFIDTHRTQKESKK